MGVGARLRLSAGDVAAVCYIVVWYMLGALCHFSMRCIYVNGSAEGLCRLALWLCLGVPARLSGELVLAEEVGDFGDEIVNASDDAEADGADGAPDAGE